MDKNDIKNYTDIVKNNIENNLNTIASIVYKYDVGELFKQLKDLTEEEHDKIIENCINDCLSKIQNKNFNNKILSKIEHDIDEILDFYDNETLAEIIEEASCVSFDLIKKATGYNDRKLSLPIALDYVKTYCIHNIIKEEDIQLTTIFILLHLSSFIYCLDHNNYNDED